VTGVKIIVENFLPECS